MRCIVDANVLLPILTEGHSHQRTAFAWWEQCGDGEAGLCQPVRMALLRLLTNIRVMGSSTLRPGPAWDVVQQLIDDPRVSRVDAVRGTHDAQWRANVVRREPTPNLWTDAWLAALAQTTDTDMITFDQNFRSFARLRLVLL